MLELRPLDPTKREVIDGAKAKGELVPTWGHQVRGLLVNSEFCDKIDLSGKSYNTDGMKAIAAFLTSTENFQPSVASQIKSAILSDIIASQPEKEALEVLTTICDAFKESRLEEVDLSDNALGMSGVNACKTVLSGEAVVYTLKHLKLCNNGLSAETMVQVAKLLTEGDSTCIAKNIETIHFFNNMSGDEGCEAFKTILQCAEHLQDVRFSGTRARDKGCFHITSALQNLAEKGKLNSIVRLDFADNSFGACYEGLAHALQRCTKLEYLDLDSCCLGDNGVFAVCQSLIQAKPRLGFLSLSDNDISVEGGKSVATLIEAINDTIVSFNASENQLKSPGICSIARAFKSGTVEEIRLNQNECGRDGAEELMKMAPRLQSLKVIEVDDNDFQSDIVDGLKKVFGDKLSEVEGNIDDENYDDKLDSGDLEDVPEPAMDSVPATIPAPSNNQDTDASTGAENSRSNAMLGNHNATKKDHGTKEVCGKIWEALNDHPSWRSTNINGRRYDLEKYCKAPNPVHDLPLEQSLMYSSNPSLHPPAPVCPSDHEHAITTTAHQEPEANVTTSRDGAVALSRVEGLFSDIISGRTTNNNINVTYIPIAPGATYVAPGATINNNHGGDLGEWNHLRERVQENSADLHTVANRLGMTLADLRTPDVNALAQRLQSVDIGSEPATGGTVVLGTPQGGANATVPGVDHVAEPDIDNDVDTASRGNQALAEVSSNAVGDDEEVVRPASSVATMVVEPPAESEQESNFDEAALWEKTVVVLRDILRDRGLRVSGRKANLVQRIMDDDNQVYD